MKLKNIFFTVIAFTLIMVSCKKETNDLSKGTFSVSAPNSGSWTYFSFSKNDTVTITGKAEESTAWDLAFQQFYIKTNSGTSGKGVGGAFNTLSTGNENYTKLKTVPDTASFIADDSVSFHVAGGKVLKLSVNSVLSHEANGWFNYDYQTHIVTSKLNVYVIKTAAGKYAKFYIKSYLYGAAKSTFDLEFSYQPDGSKTLE